MFRRRDQLACCFTCLVLAGCPDDPDVDDDTYDETPCVDFDGDGSCQPDDCNDNAPSVHPGAEDICNGIDDDCDGLTDEGSLDSDGDGMPDCLDYECDAAFVPAGSVDLDSTCVWQPDEPVEDPWDIVVEWRYDNSGEEEDWGVYSTPMVARLAQGELPSILFTTYHGRGPSPEDDLIVLSGDGFSIDLQVDNLVGWSNPIIADVDGDGEQEIVASRDYDSGSNDIAIVVAFDIHGHIEWTSPALSEWLIGGGSLTAADLDGDGTVEVVYYKYVLSGDDGQLLHTLDVDDDSFHTLAMNPVVADLDGDGTTEILVGAKVFDHTGAMLWQAADFEHGGNNGYLWIAVADLDLDATPEVVFATDYYMAVFEHDGTRTAQAETSNWVTGPPCIADYDGDGEPEIAVPNDSHMTLFDRELNQVWSVPATGNYGAVACSAFDFDVDGAYEIIYSGNDDFRILDGATGEAQFIWSEHSSIRGGICGPSLADIDDDGSVEIIIDTYPDLWDPLEQDTIPGITVLGHANNGWPPAGPYWGMSYHAPLRVHDDGLVESPTPPWWNYYNMYHARPPGDGLPDLVAVPGEVCVASCDHGPIKVTWGVANQGLGEAYHPVSAALYAVDGETATPLEVTEFPDVLRYGSQLSGGLVELSPDDCRGGLRLVVDDDGTGVSSVDECNEDNNIWEIPGPLCP